MDTGALALPGESMGWRGPGLGSLSPFWAYLAAAGTAHLPQDPQAGRPSTPVCSLTLRQLPPLRPGATSFLSLSKALGSAALLEAILPRPPLPSVSSVALAGGLDRGAGRHPRLLPAPSPLRPAPGPGPTETSGGSSESGTGRLAGLAGPESVFGGPRSSCLNGNSPEAQEVVGGGQGQRVGSRQADTTPGGAGVAPGAGHRLWLAGAGSALPRTLGTHTPAVGVGWKGPGREALGGSCSRTEKGSPDARPWPGTQEAVRSSPRPGRRFVPVAALQEDRPPPPACLQLPLAGQPPVSLSFSMSSCGLSPVSPGRNYGLLFRAVQPPGPWGTSANAGGGAPAAGGHEEVDGPAGQE